jgi:hypothetical protein
MNAKNLLVVLTLVTAASLQAQTATRKAPETAQPSSEQRCAREVREYVDTMKFIRQSAGNQIADKVGAGLDEIQLQRVVLSQGHCAAAQLLKERGPIRSAAS